MEDIFKAKIYLQLLKVAELKDILKNTTYALKKNDKKANLVDKILELLQTGQTDIMNADEKAVMYNKIKIYSQKIQSAKNPDTFSTLTNIVHCGETPVAGSLINHDVRLKCSPFSEKICTLIEPCSLLRTNLKAKEHSRCFSFILEQQQVKELIVNKSHTIVELRFCLLDNKTEQNDNFPKNLKININGKICPLPHSIAKERGPPIQCPGPINITPYLKLLVKASNVVWCDWVSESSWVHAISCYMMRKVSSEQLLNDLKIKSVRSINDTTELIKEKMNETDAEIATTSLRISLNCPLGKMRMITPCRATTCLHLQCFDAALYLEMNEKKERFICPVCDKPALYENLVIDDYFKEVLNSSSLSADDHDIELKKDGSWTKYCDKSVIFNLDSSQESQLQKETMDTTDLTPIIDCEVQPEVSLNEDSIMIDLTVTTPVRPKPLASIFQKTLPVIQMSIKPNDTVDLTSCDSDDNTE
ncbi:unnamed protein product [Diamesa serratosioi]